MESCERKAFMYTGEMLPVDANDCQRSSQRARFRYRFLIGKETRAKSRSNINGLATSEGIANNGEAVKVLIPAPDETDLRIFIQN